MIGWRAVQESILGAGLWWTLAVLGPASPACWAEEPIQASVERQGERFVLHSESLIRAPVSQVRAILSRFEELPRINDGIKSVQLLARRDNGEIRMRVSTEVCILLICLDWSWVQEVKTLANGDIEAVIVPAESDFREGWTRYRFRPEHGNTRLIFDASLVPNFWVPPALGPWIIERKLAREALETAQAVERLGRSAP